MDASTKLEISSLISEFIDKLRNMPPQKYFKIFWRIT
jgi:hypothetical protein